MYKAKEIIDSLILIKMINLIKLVEIILKYSRLKRKENYCRKNKVNNMEIQKIQDNKEINQNQSQNLKIQD